MKITVNPNKEYQTFENFGASGAWWAQEVGSWSHEDPISKKPVNERIAELLYSKTEGIGLGIYRYNLGGGSKNSNSSNFYNKNRLAENFDAGEGKYDWNRDKAAVHMMNLCIKQGADEVILFSNSPPERLTKNHKSCLDKAWHTNLSRENEEKFVLYLLDVAEHFVKEGIPVKYISPVNEPLWIWTENKGQEGCHYKPYGVYSLLKKLAVELEKRPILKDVKISAAENGDIRWFNKTYTLSVLADKTVRNNIDGIDIHSYCLPIPLKFLNNRVGFLKRYRKFMDVFFPDVKIKMSEWTHMQGGRDKGMDSALVCAATIYEDISILRVTSWQHWIAVSEVDYCDGLIYINEDSKTFETTKRLYVTGNFSKYIPKNSIRIDIESDDKNLMPLAFKKDKKTVLVLTNPENREKHFSVDFKGKITIAITDENCDLEEKKVICDGEITLSPRSVTTIVY